MQKIEDDLLAEEGARVWRDEAAEEFLAKHKAKAMYVPGEPGKPGVMVFSRTASRAEVLEEIKHLKQHKSLKFASLTTEQIIQLEIEAQQHLIRYARRKGWSDAEIKQFEDNLKYWEKQQAELAKGGDAAKVVEGEVAGFRMRDDAQELANSMNEHLPDFCSIETKGNWSVFIDKIIGKDIAYYEIGDDGFITFAIYRKDFATKATGKQIFFSFMKNIELRNQKIKGINGSWGINSDNTKEFNDLIINNNLTLEAAAQKTWTGQRAAQWGYTEVKSVKTNPDVPPFIKIDVQFTKPQ